MKFIRTKSFKLAVYARGNKDAGRLALILPGRLDTKDYAHMRSHVEYLADKGFYAVSFDVPGTWESPGNLTDYTTSLYIKVVEEIIEHFNKPTILIGHSRGGAVAMLVGVNDTSVIAMVMVMATYGSPTPANAEAVKLGYQVERRDLPGKESRTVMPRIYKLPIGFFKDGEKYHPGEVLKKSTKPKLLIYGTRDEFTSPEKVKAIYESLPKPKVLHELDSEHDYRYRPEIIKEVNETIGQFLASGVK